MTTNEKKLINIIRESDDPAAAIMTASVVILGYLKQLESCSEQDPADLSAHA